MSLHDSNRTSLTRQLDRVVLAPSRLLGSIFLALCLSHLTWASAHATTCGYLGWPAQIDNAEVIFQGTVESRVSIPFIFKSTTVRVTRVWKGPLVSRYRIQQVPNFDLIMTSLGGSPSDRGDDLVVFGAYLPFGLSDGGFCSATFLTENGFEPELSALLGPGEVPTPTLLDYADIMPGWAVLVVVCVLCLVTSWTSVLRNPSVGQLFLNGARSGLLAGALGGATLAVVLITSMTPIGPRINGSVKETLADLAFLTLIPATGAVYGILVGLFVGPFSGLYLGHGATSHLTRNRTIAGAGLGFLVGWTIVGNHSYHFIMAASVISGVIGGAVSGWLFRRGQTITHHK